MRGTTPDRSRASWALVAVSLGFAVVQLDVSVVNVAIEPIGSDLGGSLSDLQWVVDAYTITFAGLILSAGSLGDRVGAKRVFLAGFALFTLASVGCGVAPSLGLLVLARAVQGVGAAVLVPCSLALLNHAYPAAADRARAVGLWAAGASVALSAGPLVGGVLTATVGWRAVFLINFPLGLLGIVLATRYAAETTRTPTRSLDLHGQLAGLVTLVAVSAATIEGGRTSFTEPVVVGSYALAALAGAAFVRNERRATDPMLPLALFRVRSFAVPVGIGFVINVAFYGLIFVLSLYFQEARGLSVLQTGLAFAPTTLAVLVGNLSAGRLTAALGARRVLAGGGALVAVSVAGLLVVAAGTPYAALVVQLVVLGLGLGVIVPAMTTQALGSVEPARSGMASGALNTARQTGSVVGVAVFGALAAGGLVHGVRAALAISCALGLAVVALAGALDRS
ncbi:MFS transporter [Luteimicrobium sp. NPDC057192]|uniref:MFS transporter n=1 Tax=Luteimicrobium sp. NPDC057192 TaxID=3346042 RepID=UPI00363F31E1